MYFQTLDDKTECVGIYKDGELHFDNFPSDLMRTWKYSGSITDDDIEYGWLYTQGKTLKDACPPEYAKELNANIKKMEAFFKSFQIAKLDMSQHCIFDLIPEDSLAAFCEIKNKITEYVFATHDKPDNYNFLNNAYKLLYSIREREINIDISDCKNMFTATNNRLGLQKITKGSRHIDYNLFGTVTGRLTTYPNSFPILTMKKDFRRIIKPHNDWFLSLDYNGAEVRTVLALLGHPQPQEDIHAWNMANVFNSDNNFVKYPERSDAKVLFFGWLYNPDSEVIKSDLYDREAIINDMYADGKIRTPFGREIEIDRRRALSYIVQSTTSDLVLERSVEISKMLEDTKSFVSHVIHDEVVIDLADEDRYLVPEIKEIFSKNRLDTFMVNISAGKNFYDLEELKI
ncbi:MAG: hypothetical protein CMC82_04630 [Flavobacteriaceae bacterium]|nr:hypothetical protein [Flavobacteriaceae bacterium]|tara:strand:+ start:507 stop:1709 length:1203 start_codon:yes stop_codon:yes gene_type:complete